MKNIIIITLGLVWIAIIALLIVGSGNNDTTEMTIDNQAQDMSAIPNSLESTINTAMERQSMENVTVIDVRTDQEWNELHATGALHWGLAEHLNRGELPPIDTDTEIYVYCRSGNRSAQAIQILQEEGYTNLTNIGGLDDWIQAGGQTTSGVDTSNK